ncbi:MAG: tetratricopeptide repeat-containing protein, partial [Acidobacteria bacterium]
MKAGRAAYEQADFATAEKQFKVAFTAATKFELGDPRAVRTLNAIGNLYRAEDKTDAAEAFLSKARAMAEAWLGAESPELATALNNLGGLYTSEQRFAKAEEVLRPALAMREKLLGPEHPEVAATLCNLG